MKRLAVAATAAALATPLAVNAAAPAQAAPSRTTATYTAVSYSNKYARAARSAGPLQKDRNATHLSKLTRNAGMTTAQRARYIAPALKGVPYRWGGTTTRGFDCSGFTRYVFAKAGKNLPRTAATQYRATKRTSNPRPGDLVFFGGSRAYHVGIYVGNGRMIHAPRAGKPVQIAKIWRGASYGKVR